MPRSAASTDVFPPIYRALVNAGEKSGELHDAACAPGRLSREPRRRPGRRSCRHCSIPLIVVVVAFAVITGLVTYVVPQIVGVFTHSKQSLPLLTQALILVSDVLRASGVWLALGAAGAVVLVRRALRNEALRLRWHARLLEAAAARPVPAHRRQRAVRQHHGDPGGQRRAAAGRARGGQGRDRQSACCAARWSARSGWFARAARCIARWPPRNFSRRCSFTWSPAARRAARSTRCSARAAQQQQTELDHRTALALGLFEPLLILLMGGLVLLIVLAVLLPIININLLLR